MVIQKISEKEFSCYNVQKNSVSSILGREIEWLEEKENNLLTTIINDQRGNDWSYMILAKQPNEEYRAIEIDCFMESQEVAVNKALEKLRELINSGGFSEEFYSNTDHANILNNLTVLKIAKKIKASFKQHIFKSKVDSQHVIMDAMEDLGIEVFSPKVIIEKGKKIIASINNSYINSLVLIEFKKRVFKTNVKISIIKQVVGMQTLKNPAKSMIIATNNFSKKGFSDTKLCHIKLDLKQYDQLKEWLSLY